MDIHSITAATYFDRNNTGESELPVNALLIGDFTSPLASSTSVVRSIHRADLADHMRLISERSQGDVA